MKINSEKIISPHSRLTNRYMSKIVLAKEGVFPIVKNASGEFLNQTPATGIELSGTIQGEGKLAGVPSLFIRLSGCNLRCIWRMTTGALSCCDTTYASFDTRDSIQIEVSEVFQLVQQNLGPIRHVVITGGEALLQKQAVSELCALLKTIDGLHLTLETNGTLFDENVAQHIDLFSISPKLSNSVPDQHKLSALGLNANGPFLYHTEKRYQPEVLQRYLHFIQNNEKELQLKFVVGQESDAEEIKNMYLQKLTQWNNSHIMVMPLGATAEQITVSQPIALKACIENGWRYSPRVHIELFGSKSGV